MSASFGLHGEQAGDAGVTRQASRQFWGFTANTLAILGSRGKQVSQGWDTLQDKSYFGGCTAHKLAMFGLHRETIIYPIVK